MNAFDKQDIFTAAMLKAYDNGEIMIHGKTINAMVRISTSYLILKGLTANWRNYDRYFNRKLLG